VTQRHADTRKADVIRVVVMVAILALGVAPGPTSAAGVVPATETVKLWLRALHDGNAETLESLTAVPFAYREAWPKKQCSQVAKDAAAIRKWLDCARKKEDLLIEELRWEKDDPNHAHLRLGLDAAAKKLRALAKGSVGKTWVNGFINGDGVTYGFLFALDGDDAVGWRIAAMFIDASFDSG
jgi:hypothetical protein